jgi:hypothetical protein
VLTPGQAVEQVGNLRGYHLAERSQLNIVRRYWQGVQNLPILIPQDAPREMKTLARISRVNVCKIVVDSLAQSLFVDGFREDPTTPTNGTSRRSGRPGRRTRWTRASRADPPRGGRVRRLLRVVLPGDPYPVIRPCRRGR